VEIQIRQYASGAKQARDTAVVIDVFRAFTVACVALARGAKKIVAVGEIETARDLRKRFPESILIGERHAQKLPGFDYGNSPSEIQGVDFSGRRVIHTTHAGTRALTAAADARDVITGSFVNAGAVTNYIRSRSPQTVSLICAGSEGQAPALEDTLCAEYLRDQLTGAPTAFEAIRKKLQNSESARRFFDPAQTGSPAADFGICLDLDRFSFVVRRRTAGPDWCELQAEVPWQARQ